MSAVEVFQSDVAGSYETQICSESANGSKLIMVTTIRNGWDPIVEFVVKHKDITQARTENLQTALDMYNKI